MANFMPKHNPRYADPTYKAVPTPIPAHLIEQDDSVNVPEKEEKPASTPRLKLTNKRASIAAPPPESLKPEKPEKPTVSKLVKAAKLPNFDGMSFQKAQEQLLQEMVDLRDEESVSYQAAHPEILTALGATRLRTTSSKSRTRINMPTITGRSRNQYRFMASRTECKELSTIERVARLYTLLGTTSL